MDSSDPMGRKRVTNLLCVTLSSEEKRKIIGDTFIKVSAIIFAFCTVKSCSLLTGTSMHSLLHVAHLCLDAQTTRMYVSSS